MNMSTSSSDGVIVIQAGPARLVHSSLGPFSTEVTGALARGERRLVIDLSQVEYLDSAAIGCLMDLFRQATGARATLKLAGLQKRVETMLTLTGTDRLMEVHPDVRSAVASF